MKNLVWLLKWILKAAIFFTLFAFALNNQQEAAVRFFFGTEWRAPMVLVVLAAFALGLALGVLAMVPRWWRHRQNTSTTVVEPAAAAASPMAPPQAAEAAGDTASIPAMDFDLGWILLGLPIAFVLGWMASRLDLRQMRIENRRAPKAYFKGLNYLLNEQQDQAIDAFIEAVQKDPDTTELHFALGNLFRRRGEYQRAVRVHEHLLSRADLNAADRQRAQHDLALDFLKAGLLDRAEDALRKLEGGPYETQARLALLAIYERSRDWPLATEIAQKLQDNGEGSFSGRMAHYLCEQAAACNAAGDTEGARQLLGRAIPTAPQAPRPRIDMALMQVKAGQQSEALRTLLDLGDAAPQAMPLIANAMAQAATAAGQADQALAALQASYESFASLDVLDAIVMLESARTGQHEVARQRYLQHLEREQSLVATARWLAGEKLEHEQFHPQVQRAIEHATRPLTRYRCAACGFEAKQHFWQCPGCQAWDSYPPRRVEEL